LYRTFRSGRYLPRNHISSRRRHRQLCRPTPSSHSSDLFATRRMCSCDRSTDIILFLSHGGRGTPPHPSSLAAYGPMWCHFSQHSDWEVLCLSWRYCFSLFLFVCIDFVCICYSQHITAFLPPHCTDFTDMDLTACFLVLRTLSLFYFIIIIIVLSATMSWWNKAYQNRHFDISLLVIGVNPGKREVLHTTKFCVWTLTLMLNGKWFPIS